MPTTVPKRLVFTTETRVSFPIWLVIPVIIAVLALANAFNSPTRDRQIYNDFIANP